MILLCRIILERMIQLASFLDFIQKVKITSPMFYSKFPIGVEVFFVEGNTI